MTHGSSSCKGICETAEWPELGCQVYHMRGALKFGGKVRSCRVCGIVLVFRDEAGVPIHCPCCGRRLRIRARNSDARSRRNLAVARM